MTMGNVGLRMNLLRTSNSMVTPTFIPWCKPPKLPSTEFNNKSHVLREARDKFIGPWCLHPLKWLVLFFFIQISLSLSLQDSGEKRRPHGGVPGMRLGNLPLTHYVQRTFIWIRMMSQVRYEETSRIQVLLGGVLLTWRRNGDDDF